MAEEIPVPSNFPDNLAFDYYKKLKEFVKYSEKRTIARYEGQIKNLLRIALNDGLDSRQLNTLTKLKKDAVRRSDYSAYDATLRQMSNRVLRHDQESKEINKILEELRNKSIIYVSTTKARKIANEFVRNIRKFSIKQVDDQVKAIAGVRPTLRNPKLSNAVQSTLDENVRLIKTIPKKYHDEVERVIHEGVVKGQSMDEITKNVYDAGRKTTNNARLIARDQSGNISMAVTKHRQKQLGLQHFIWRTVGDDRVRESHKSRNGRRYSWKDGAGGEYPGGPIQCRCVAEPDRSEVKQRFGKLSEGQPSVAKTTTTTSYNTTQEWRDNIPEEQLQAVENYTGSSYRGIRKAQLGEELPESVREKYQREAELVEQAFETAPNYDGEIYRGIDDISDDAYDTLVNSDEITFDAVASASKKEKVGRRYSGSRNGIVFKIQSKTGVDVSDISVFEDEAEVVVKNNTKFKVKDVNEEGRLTEMILEEVVE